ncbi:MAG: Unknown protein [uncultured Sulfurovum sp.]|uniref:Uncharacterized protein n=1 Tax=uncultured Sulfurovum sp. TaxID=269237 RepID=A0A6S6TYD2_9BACT|nr:MAG: Unknown protein [uncultured Sulfurovum sp.]
MQTIKIEVSNSIYEHIIFFLQSLPKNLINISHENNVEEIPNDSIKNQMKELFTNSDITAFKEIDNPVSWQKSMRDEWE